MRSRRPRTFTPFCRAPISSPSARRSRPPRAGSSARRSFPAANPARSSPMSRAVAWSTGRPAGGTDATAPSPPPCSTYSRPSLCPPRARSGMQNALISPHCSAVHAGWDDASFAIFLDNLDRFVGARPCATSSTRRGDTDVPRIAIAGFQHETNSFATSIAGLAEFEMADAWPSASDGRRRSSPAHTA
jgi:hypothetical protein